MECPYFRNPKKLIQGKGIIDIFEGGFRVGALADAAPPSIRIKINGVEFIVVEGVKPVKGTRTLDDLIRQNSASEIKRNAKYVPLVADLFRKIVQNSLDWNDPDAMNIVVGSLDGRLGAWVVDADLMKENKGLPQKTIAQNILSRISKQGSFWLQNSLFYQAVKDLLQNWNAAQIVNIEKNGGIDEPLPI